MTNRTNTKTKKLTVREKIVKFLTRNNVKEFTSKGIANAAKLNHNTVRKELGRLTVGPYNKVEYGLRSRNGYYTYRAGCV